MKILVIDDEAHVRRLVGDYLRHEGFTVLEAANGQAGIDWVLADKEIELVLLDVRMPKMDGFAVIKELKTFSNLPVIFLTANDDTSQEVKGLSLGAFDYITKPFSYEVLVARVRSCLLQLNRLQPDVIIYKSLKINMSSRQVTLEDVPTGMTQKEFDILSLLIRNKNMTLDRDRLLNKVWGFDYYGDQRTVDTHIKTLRAKMGIYGKMIKTVRGVGYYIEMDE